MYCIICVMERQPKCYQTSEDEWVSTLSRRSGNSVAVTVPKAIMKAMCLRPGMVVRVRIERMRSRPEAPPEDENDPAKVPSIMEGSQ